MLTFDGNPGEIIRLFGLLMPDQLDEVMVRIGMAPNIRPPAEVVYAKRWPKVYDFADDNGRRVDLHRVLHEIVATNFTRRPT